MELEEPQDTETKIKCKEIVQIYFRVYTFSNKI